MDRTTAFDEAPLETTRRVVLTRAALLAGTAAWTLPAVQVLGMSPASADLASGDGGGGPGCTPASPSASASARTVDVVALVSTSGPAGSAAIVGEGTAAPGDGGPGPFLATPTPTSSVFATTLSAHTEASVLPAGGPTEARSLATATVDSLVLVLPGGVRVDLEALTSQATASVTSAGLRTPTRTSTVAQVRVRAPGVDETLTLPPTGTQTVAGLVRLTFAEGSDTLGDRMVSTTVTALQLETLAPLPAVDIVVARSTATAAFPDCVPTP